MIEKRKINITSHIADEELVKKVQQGDVLAFETLVNRYEQKIYNVIYRILGNESATSDILQETFLQVYRSINSFKSQSKFSTWLYRIAVNFALMYKRSKKPVVSLDTPVDSEDGEQMHREIKDWADNPAADSDNAEIKRKINEAIEKLPQDYRSALILRDIDGLSNKEVGKILKLSVPAVKSRIHRARIFLRDNLSAYFKKQ
jgi:RNA polymerase sigma-70 factor (ECF subfamily)